MSESNPEIALIEKWLDNPESVSAEERERAVARAGDTMELRNSALDFAIPFNFDFDACTRRADTARAVARATRAATNDDVDAAKYWIQEYKELTR